MDVAQFLEFMLGSQLAITKPDKKGKVDAAAVREKLLDKAIADLRDVIETTLPVIYLVKTKDIVNNILLAMQEMDEAQLSKYISSVRDLEGIEGVVGPTEPGFIQIFEDVYNELYRSFKSGGINTKLLEGLNSRFKKTISFKDLSKQTKNILDTINAASNAYAVTTSIGTSSDTEKITEELRTVIQKGGTDLRAYLVANTPAKFIDASEILSNFDPDSELLLVGATFAGLKKAINEVCSPILQSWFESKGISITSALNAGSFTAAGHVAVKNEIEEIIGINTPLTQSTLYYANQEAKSNLTMDTFILDSTHVDCALVVNKNFTADFKNLLSLNFSFIISQETTFNSVTLRIAEVAAMNSIVEKTFKTTRDQLTQSFLKTIASKKGLDYLVSKLRFSPTVSESIALQIASAISGKSNKTLATGKAKNAGKSSPISAKKLPIGKTVNKKSKSSSSGNQAVPAKHAKKGIVSSLVNLQTLLNSQIQAVIAKNMGKGTSRNILNYRTGRFAESVKVERITESKAGMITAFYSYMKNPYQTFEPGYAQGSPESRNPRLLIAKSIREIAAQTVANRLRSVLV